MYPHNEKIRKAVAGCSDLVVEKGLNYLIPKWKSNVQDIELDEIEDYLNDLDGRMIIDRILDLLDDGERRLVENDLHEIDLLFKSKTVEVKENVWGPNNERTHKWSRDKNWYYYRAPKSLLSSQGNEGLIEKLD